MKISQVSVFIENQSGRVYEITRLMGDNKINIRALSLADTSDFGIIRFIVNKPDEAQEVLKSAGFTVGRNDVLAVAVADQPGGLANLLQVLDSSSLNVEYMYAFVNHSGKDAVMIFRFDDVDTAAEILTKNGIRLLPEGELFNI